MNGIWIKTKKAVQPKKATHEAPGVSAFIIKEETSAAAIMIKRFINCTRFMSKFSPLVLLKL
jgi:hypothetical protein